MSTVILKTEVQARIDALSYPIDATELLQNAVDTVGLGLDLTNIIAVHTSATNAITGATSGDDITALNAASIALGITSNSGTSGGGVPIDGQQAFPSGLPSLINSKDGTVWLKEGFVSTDIELYPDAQIRYDTTPHYVGAGYISGISRGFSETYYITRATKQKTIWGYTSTAPYLREFDEWFNYTGRTISPTNSQGVETPIGNFCIDPITDRLICFLYSTREVFSCDQDGSNVEHDFIKNMSVEGYKEFNTYDRTSALFFKDGLIHQVKVAYNGTHIYVIDSDYSYVSYELRDDITFSSVYTNKFSYYLEDKNEIVTFYNVSTTSIATTILSLDNMHMYISKIDDDDYFDAITLVAHAPWLGGMLVCNVHLFYNQLLTDSRESFTPLPIFNQSSPTSEGTFLIEAQGKILKISASRVLTVYSSIEDGMAPLIEESSVTIEGAGAIYGYASLNDKIWVLNYTDQTLERIDLDGNLIGSAIPLNTDNGQSGMRHLYATDTEMYVSTYNKTGAYGCAIYDEDGTFLRFIEDKSTIRTDTRPMSWDNGAKRFWVYRTTSVLCAFDRELNPLYGIRNMQASAQDVSILGGGRYQAEMFSNSMYIREQVPYHTPFVGNPIVTNDSITQYTRIK